MAKFNKKNKALQQFFVVLLTSVGVFCLAAVLFVRIIPDIQWKLQRNNLQNISKNKIASQESNNIVHTSVDVATYSSTTFQLVIPKIGVNMPIVTNEVDGTSALNRGAWHIPGSGTFISNGNSDSFHNNLVIAGHRFLYTSGPETFFHLDKLEENDEITVIWEGEEYSFVVKNQEIVGPDAVEILDNTDIPRLTLFTCHPVFSTAERLVIYAYPKEILNRP